MLWHFPESKESLFLQEKIKNLPKVIASLQKLSMFVSRLMFNSHFHSTKYRFHKIILTFDFVLEKTSLSDSLFSQNLLASKESKFTFCPNHLQVQRFFLPVRTLSQESCQRSINRKILFSKYNSVLLLSLFQTHKTPNQLRGFTQWQHQFYCSNFK